MLINRCFSMVNDCTRFGPHEFFSIGTVRFNCLNIQIYFVHNLSGWNQTTNICVYNGIGVVFGSYVVGSRARQDCNLQINEVFEWKVYIDPVQCCRVIRIKFKQIKVCLNLVIGFKKIGTNTRVLFWKCYMLVLKEKLKARKCEYLNLKKCFWQDIVNICVNLDLVVKICYIIIFVAPVEIAIMFRCLIHTAAQIDFN